MKNVETYKGSGEMVSALQDADIEQMRPIFREIEYAWYEQWLARGQKDEGSCCLGIGISVYYLPPRARYPRLRQVIQWTWSQGDFEAERTKDTPIKALAKYGASAVYNCGRMD
jgi:hypothetical protein